MVKTKIIKVFIGGGEFESIGFNVIFFVDNNWFELLNYI
jgi:hypothetical protein